MIVSMMDIIFFLLILGHAWLILSCINRTNVPQLDVKSHGNAVRKEYETVPCGFSETRRVTVAK